MTVNKDNRTERQKVIDKFLMLYVINSMNETCEEVTEEKLQTRIWAIQIMLKNNNMETFSYDDWVWDKEE